MSLVDIIKPENGHIWNARGDQVNDKLFEAVLLSWSAEKLDSLHRSVVLYSFMQKIVKLYTKNCTKLYKYSWHSYGCPTHAFCSYHSDITFLKSMTSRFQMIRPYTTYCIWPFPSKTY